MWLFTKQGFFSVVQHEHHKSTLLVRSRSKDDLENLQKMIKRHPVIKKTPDADYLYRMVVMKEEFGKVASELALDIDYPNFKDEIKKNDARRARLYSSVWWVMREIKDRLSSWKGE